MSTPVTRGDLEQRFEQNFKQMLAVFSTKVELELWGGALLARIAAIDQRITETDQRIVETEHRLSTELARHTTAILEAMRVHLAAVLEPYVDLPGRTSRLEAEVFVSKQR